MTEADIVIVGAGVVGASLAWRLAPHRRVVVLEREDQPGYHSTGRSAAHYTEVIGTSVIQALSAATRGFLDAPPEGFSAHPLVRLRPALLVMDGGETGSFQDGDNLDGLMGRVLFRIDGDACLQHCPVLRRERVAWGLFEPNAADIDVHAIHGGYIAAARRAGAGFVTDAEVTGLARRDGVWQLETRAGAFSAPVVANCAGAWGDVLAGLAGIAPLGLQPCRRTAFTFRGPDGVDVADWPLVADGVESFYFKPEAGLLLGSLADQTPSPPCDAQPEEIDIAQAAQNIMDWTTLEIRRLERRWAGLRSFLPDKLPAVGWDAKAEGFFWDIGQGGAGIQTSAALSAYAAALVLGEEVPATLQAAGVTRATLDPARFGSP